MRMGGRARGLFSLLVAALTIGCSPTVVVTYSHCPVPVLISPVDRVGGERPTLHETGKRDVLTASSSFTQSTQQSGQWTYTRTNTSGPMGLTFEVLRLVPNQTDVDASDILLDGVSTGTFMTLGYVKIWGDPEGRKVWVK